MPSTYRRLRALGDTLCRLDADVICLQEVQAHPYRRLLVRLCAEQYPHHAFAPFLHAPKGGLLTLSRHPISESRFVLYRERGLWYTPALADWILHKGVLFTHLQYGAFPVTILNTHLTANYSGDWSPRNRFALHEWEQLQQLADLVSTQSADTLVLVMGDFNIPRGSWLSDQFLERSGLIDPLAGDQRPTFRLMPGMPSRYLAAIDFNLYRAPSGLELSVQSDLCFEQKYTLSDGRTAYLSDHIGVELRQTW
ncbi:MAG: endonuclease/exonuclease/phosphatase family protein [Anaerolineae bacterium]|nr:endonuclease/exonuclease/phosphatase family protein [Anaerolineae bacterium]